MREKDNVDYSELGTICGALSSSNRILALEVIEKSSVLDTAEKCGMSRSGFQRVLDDFRDTGLIKNSDRKGYFLLTEKGKLILNTFKELSMKLIPAAKEEAKVQLKEIILGSPLSASEMRRLIEEKERKKRSSG